VHERRVLQVHVTHHYDFALLTNSPLDGVTMMYSPFCTNDGTITVAPVFTIAVFLLDATDTLASIVSATCSIVMMRGVRDDRMRMMMMMAVVLQGCDSRQSAAS
jgi:hypothetical protein